MQQRKQATTWTPMQRLTRALSRGMYFGAQLGMALAIGSFLLTGNPFMGGIFSEAFGFSGLHHITNVIAETFSGIVVGAAVGGIGSAVLHATVHAIPGMPYLLGDAPPRFKDREAGLKPQRGQQRSQNTGRSPRLEEANDRNYGFRRMIEEQRIQEQQQDIGR